MKMMLFSIIDAYKPSVDTDYIQKERKQEESNNINQGNIKHKVKNMWPHQYTNLTI